MLGLGVGLERVDGQVLAVPGLLEASMGHLGHQQVVIVDPHRSELQLAGGIESAADVVGEHGRGQAIISAVGPIDDFLVASEAGHTDDGAEHLPLNDLVILPGAGDNGRLVEEAAALPARPPVAIRPEPSAAARCTKPATRSRCCSEITGPSSVPSANGLSPGARLRDLRQTGQGPRNPPRNPHRHGTQLDADLSAALETSGQISIAEGVDPALVFRVRTVGRLSEEQRQNRGLELLTEGGSTEWDYVVLHPGTDPAALVRELASYQAGPDAEGAAAPLSSFFALLEHIEPYGPEDRLPAVVLTELAAGPRTRDVVIWPAATDGQARHRVEQVVAVAERLGLTTVATDSRARSPLVRLLASAQEAREIATIPVVEALRFPPTPYVDPSAWREAEPDDMRFHRT